MHGTLSRAVCFALMLCLINAGLPAMAQDIGNPKPDTALGKASSAGNDLPDSPGAMVAQFNGGTQATTNSAQQSGPANSSPQKSQQTEPSGTAVAPQVRVSGGAASKPAGVAIAPPK